jgi:hypothetical protein
MKKHRNQSDAPSPKEKGDTGAPDPGESVLDAISVVEAQLAGLKKAATERKELESQLRAREEALTEREQAILAEAESREQALSLKESDLEARVADLKRDLDVIEQERATLDARRDEIRDEHEKRHCELEAMATELAAQRQDLSQHESELAQRQEKIEEAMARLEAMQVDAQQRSAKIESRAQELELAEARLTDQAGQLSERLKMMEASEAESLARIREVEERAEQAEQERADAQARCGQAEESLEKLESALSEMRDQAAAIETNVQSRDAEVERLTGQAEELAAGVVSLRERLEAKTAELEQVEQRCAEIEAEAEARIAQVGERVSEAEKASESSLALNDEHRQRCEALEAEVKNLEAKLESTEAESLSLLEQVETLEQALRAQIEARDAAIGERDERIEELEGQLSTAAEKITQFGEFIKTRMPAESAGDTEALENAVEANAALERRIAELDAQVKELKASGGSDRHGAEPGSGASIETSRPLAFLELRRQRLSNVRASLRKQSIKVRRANELLQGRFEQCEALLSRRAELAAAHEAIQDQRNKASRHRRRSSSAGAMLAFVVTMGVLFALSWVVAEKVYPGDYSASAIVMADGGERSLSEAALEEWQAYMTQLFDDPRFMETVAESLKKRGMATLGTPASLEAALDTGLTVSSPVSGQIHLEYRDEGSTRTERVLDALTVSFVRTANRTRSRRTDGAMTHISKPAEAGREPIGGNQLTNAAGIFGGGMLLTLSFGGIVWRRMASSKSEFERDQQLQALLSEARWQDPRIDIDASEPSENPESQSSSGKRKKRPKK